MRSVSKYRILTTGLMIAVLLTASIMMACIDGSDDDTSPGETESNQEGSSLPQTGTTESGLQYTVVKQGTGPQPQQGDRVEFYYVGTLEDGTVFDRSTDGEPAVFTFQVDPIILGVEEAIGMMHVGGESKFVIPPVLGYGNQEIANVPADSTLYFEIKLLAINEPVAPQEVTDSDYKTTDNGLKYYDFKVGNGPSPENGDFLVIHSAIWRSDGLPLGNSHDMGQPQIIPFTSGGMLPGWEEGIARMHEGGNSQFVIPPELAYGENGYGDLIPPDTTLIAEVDLFKVIPVPQPATFIDIDDVDHTVLGNGMKYYDIEIGDGPSPEDGDTAIIHYTGWFTDGDQFDTSSNLGSPLVFTLGTGQVIPGFEIGISTMNAGGKRLILIPPELGYNDGKERVFEVSLEYIY